MPSLSALLLPPPRNWQDFEDLCCDLWRRLWGDSQAQKNGRTGQPQAGVDIFGRPGKGSEWAGIQCKLKGESSTLTRAEIEQEVERACTFRPPLGSFLIATTALRDVNVQEHARDITARQLQQNSFPVSIVTWEDIQNHLAEFPELVRKHYPDLFPTPIETPLEILLNRVERFWTLDVLEASLHGEALLSLGKEACLAAVEHPWGRVLEIPGQPNQTLSAEKGISEIFTDLSGFFLILGEPGAGKTTTLLELARSLIDRVREDSRAPVPVVFNLSTWATDRKPLTDWLIDEFQSKYFVSRRQALAWLQGNYLLLLLDGLDEVESRSRQDCVKAINDFTQQTGPPGLVVCSRAEEYYSLPIRLRLNGAVHLLPLTSSQVADYLNSAGVRFAVLATVINRYSELRELAQSPLMLNVMILAYQDLPITAFPEGEYGLDDVLSTYVERMFQRKGSHKPSYSRAQTLRWLTLLARQLQDQSKTLFLIEQLQPTWLETRRQHWAYFFISRLLTGTLICLSAGLPIACLSVGLPIAYLSVDGLLDIVGYSIFFAVILGLPLGLSAGFLDGMAFEFESRPTRHIRALWPIGHLAAMLPMAFVSGLLLMDQGTTLRSVLLMGLLLYLICFLSGSRAIYGLSHDIRITEAFSWSWKQSLKIGMMGVLPLVLVVLSLFLPSTGFIASIFFIAAFYIGPISFQIISISILLLFVLGGVKKQVIQIKAYPNQGVILSARNGLLAGLGIGFLAFAVLPLTKISFAEIPFIGDLTIPEYPLGWPIAWLAAMWFGFIDVINHYALRFVLWCSGRAPLKIPRFLNYATKLIFMQRVGGGYTFRHRLLLQHFASRSDRRSADVEQG